MNKSCPSCGFWFPLVPPLPPSPFSLPSPFSSCSLLGSSLCLLFTRLVFLPTCPRMHFSLGSYWFTGAARREDAVFASSWPREGTESVLVGGQHSVSEKKKAGRSFSWRSAKKRRYLVRRKHRSQCRRAAAVYLRFLYDRILSLKED